MKKALTLTFLCIMTCIITYSQSKKSKDILSIKSMCGCFKIDFNFAETFVFSEDEDSGVQRLKNKTNITNFIKFDFFILIHCCVGQMMRVMCSVIVFP